MPSPTPPPTKPVKAARLFAALADPTRLSLLITLRSGVPRSIARLSANAGMTRQAVTKHLRILADVGLVVATRTGRETHYTFLPAALDDARSYLDAVAGRWATAVRAPAAPSPSAP